jgi:hypothetical protein
MQNYPLLDLVIIGAQKSFTTSLKTYLGEHPSMVTHPQQEMAYFTDDAEYGMGYKRAFTHYYRTVEHCKGKKVIAKNAILYTSENAIKRLYDHNPDCKIILNLRNPVDRAYSAYLMEYNYADVTFPFEEIKDITVKADASYWPYTLFIDAGNYAKHLKTLYKYFQKEQVMTILFEEIKENPLKICKNIFQWLKVDDTFSPEIKVYNPTQKRGSKLYARLAVTLLKRSPVLRKSARLLVPTYYNYKIGNIIRSLNKTSDKYADMDNATRDYLLNYYKDANKELEAMIGKNVATLWSK